MFSGSRLLCALSLSLLLCPVGLGAATAQTAPPAATELAIATPKGIDEEAFVDIGGVRQWVTIRGQDRDNPVLLVVGGTAVDGPGAVMSPFVRTFLPWERDFTVVQWDPRCAGKTFAEAGKVLDPNLSLDRLVGDGLDLTDYLRAHLGRRKIVLLGVNFGSTLGVKMALARPAAFSAYVGAGQIVSNRADRERFGYERLLRLATAAGDQAALADLKISGPTPFREPRDPAKVAAFLRAGAKYRPPNPTDQVRQVLSAPHWTVADATGIQRAQALNEEKIGRDWGEHFDFTTLGPRFRVPVFVIQGEDNDTAPTPAAKAWLDRVTAPKKGFAAIPVAGNHAMETHTAAFLAELNRLVRPVAVAADRR